MADDGCTYAKATFFHLIESAKEEDKPLKSPVTNEIITPNMIPNRAFDDLLGEIDDVIRAKAAQKSPLKADYISLTAELEQAYERDKTFMELRQKMENVLKAICQVIAPGQGWCGR
jgi:hypothetical protein